MAASWEDKLRDWAKPPSQSEIDRCDAVIRNVRQAVSESAKLRELKVQVILQGSYRNNTNVKRDSDVDVGVVCPEPFYPFYPQGTDASTFGNKNSDYSYAEYRGEVEAALLAYFAQGAVSKGNKAFNVRESARQVEADVAAFLVHRRYSAGGSYVEGVELRPANAPNQRVINWPEHHYAQGVEKNKQTGGRYKALVRGLKNIRNELVDSEKLDGRAITGFLIECLLAQVPNSTFGNDQYVTDLRGILLHLYRNTDTDAACASWTEVSGMKLLFNSGQKWTRAQAHDFIIKAWQHVGLS